MTNKTIKHTVFVPIYNIRVSSDILNTAVFGDYTLVRSSRIIDKYRNYLFDYDMFSRQFLKDISTRHPDKSVFYPCANIVLVKEFENIDTDLENHKTACNIKNEVDNIILALRLVNKGLCQINNGYILSLTGEHSRGQYFATSSNIENIQNFHITRKNKEVKEDIYKLDGTVLQQAECLYKTLDTSTKHARIPIDYFNNCYDVLTPHEKIIQLAIVLESSMLAGIKDELKYRMFLRISALLGKNRKNLLSLFYDIRSHIVHNGHLENKEDNKNIWDNLRNITKLKDSNDETELLFYFVKDHIEPLVRDILYKSLNIFNEGKIKDFDTLTKKLDNFIIKKITDNTFELGNSKNE